jgi:hypothetical protein
VEEDATGHRAEFLLVYASDPQQSRLTMVAGIASCRNVSMMVLRMYSQSRQITILTRNPRIYCLRHCLAIKVSGASRIAGTAALLRDHV